MGKKWTEQELQERPLLEVLNEIRKDILDERFDTRTWDQKSPDYVQGRAHKQVMIAATKLTGRPCDVREAWRVVLTLLVGSPT